METYLGRLTSRCENLANCESADPAVPMLANAVGLLAVMIESGQSPREVLLDATQAAQGFGRLKNDNLSVC